MDVVTGSGELLTLKAADTLGVGGEGLVSKAKLRGQAVAVKVYHTPSLERGRKLQALLAHRWTLPADRVALPTDIVRDPTTGDIVGLVMPLFKAPFEDMASLSNHKYRAAFQVDTAQVAKLFLDCLTTLKAIHADGAVVGDLSDLNTLFQGTVGLWLDTDTWQVEGFPCPVGTEQFLAPELYGVNLADAPVFTRQHDYYALAVLAFKSLLLVHPYGGRHPTYKTLLAQASHHAWVLGAGVTYPVRALPPEVLSDDLLHVFEGIFKDGQRGEFPVNVLSAYAAALITCPACGQFFPATRAHCPVCQALVRHAVPSVVQGAVHTRLLTTLGPIVFSALVGDTCVVLAHEAGQLVFYRGAERRVLFPFPAGAHFEVLDERTLAMGLPGTNEIAVGDVDAPLSTWRSGWTQEFSGTRRAMFRAGQGAVYRLANDALMADTHEHGQGVSTPLMGALPGQTWFAASPQPGRALLGYYQVLTAQHYWLLALRSRYDLDLPPLRAGEAQTGVSVRFGTAEVLLRRTTQLSGVDYQYTALVNYEGQVTFARLRSRADEPFFDSHGYAYSSGVLLHATDDGLVQERLATGATKTFDATKGLVQAGDSLYRFRSGILAIGDQSVTYMEIN